MSPAEFALRAVLTKAAQLKPTAVKQAEWSFDPSKWANGGADTANYAGMGALLGGGAAYGALSSRPGERLRNAALYGLGGGAAGGLAGAAVGNDIDHAVDIQGVKTNQQHALANLTSAQQHELRQQELADHRQRVIESARQASGSAEANWLDTEANMLQPSSPLQ